MTCRAGALALLLLGCGGVPTAPTGALVLTESQPADLPRAADALLAEAGRASRDGPAGPDLERALAAAQRVLWDDSSHDGATALALRAFHYLAVRGDDAGLAAVARRCQPLASRAAAHPAAGAASLHFASVCLGHYAKATDSKDLIAEVLRLATAARASDASVDHGGPDRVLGAVFLRAPAWPVSVGDVDRATDHLEAAVGLAPGWPENQLLLAEAYAEGGRDADAARALAAAEARLSDPALAPWRASWTVMAEALRR